MRISNNRGERVATRLKLPEGLKERVASLVEGTGKSAHAFMLEAIEQETLLAEQRKQLVTKRPRIKRRSK